MTCRYWEPQTGALCSRGVQSIAACTDHDANCPTEKGALRRREPGPPSLPPSSLLCRPSQLHPPTTPLSTTTPTPTTATTPPNNQPTTQPSPHKNHTTKTAYKTNPHCLLGVGETNKGTHSYYKGVRRPNSIGDAAPEASSAGPKGHSLPCQT